MQQHVPAGGGDDLRDAGAHLPGADDEDAARTSPVEPTPGGERSLAVAQPADRVREHEGEDDEADDDLDRVAPRLVARREQRARVAQ